MCVYLNTTEAFRRFAEQQGGQPVYDASRLLFPSDARCDGNGFLVSPASNDPRQRLRQRRRYHEIKQDLLAVDMRTINAAVRGHAVDFRWPAERGSAPTDATEAAMKLDFLHAEQQDAQAKIDAELTVTKSALVY